MVTNINAVGAGVAHFLKVSICPFETIWSIYLMLLPIKTILSFGLAFSNPYYQEEIFHIIIITKTSYFHRDHYILQHLLDVFYSCHSNIYHQKINSLIHYLINITSITVLVINFESFKFRTLNTWPQSFGHYLNNYE